MPSGGVCSALMIKKQGFPEDRPDYLRELDRCRVERQAAERRRAELADELVTMVGLERRDRERRVARNNQAKARAKEVLLRIEPIVKDYKRRVMRKARGIVSTKYPWEQD